MNQLQKLISNYLSTNNLKKSEFIKQLGYANISKGSRRVSEFLETPNPEFAELILKNTDIPESAFELAYSAVQNDLESHRKLEFIPMIRVIPKRRPSPLFSLILYNIPVPENITQLDFDEEIRIICNLYQVTVHRPS